MRCFTGIPVSAEARSALAGLRARGEGVSWTPPGKLHVTLIFLGEVAEARIPEVSNAVERASALIEPFSFSTTSLGAFPSRNRPRILWCGVSDLTAGCAPWVAAAQPLLHKLGFDPEERRYTPHVTLARARSPRGAPALSHVLQTANAPTTVTRVDEVVLYESRLGEPTYRPLAAFSLRARPFSQDTSAGPAATS